MAHDIPKPPNLDMPDSAWRDLTKPGAQAIAAMQKQITSLKGRINSNPSSRQLDFSGKDGGISDEMSILIDRAKDVEESLSKLQGSLGSVVYNMPEFQKGMRDAYTAMEEFAGQGKLGREAYETLGRSLKGFMQIAGSAELNNATSHMMKQQVNLTTALSEQAAALNLVGLGYRDFAQNVDTAIYSFGLNAKQVQEFNFEIKQMADTLKMAPGDISSNFNRLSKSMAYDLETIRGQFVRFQKLSLQTGVGFDTLTSKFGANMDTISGASSAAANINMLLGRNVFSATQLLTMPDAERAEAMRNAIMSDPSIMADINRGGTTGKFALQTVASQMGMSVDEARRFITTGEKPDKEKKGGSVKSQIGEELNKALGPAKLKELGNGIDKLGETIDRVNQEILMQASPTERSILMNRREKLRALREGQVDTSLFADLAQTMDLGVMPGNLQNADVAQVLFKNKAADRTIQRFIKNVQRGTIEEADFLKMFKAANPNLEAESLSDIFKLLNSANLTERQAAESAMASAVATGEGPNNAFQEVLKKMGPGALSGYQLLYDNSEYAARVLARRLIQMNKSNEDSQIRNVGEKLIELGKLDKAKITDANPLTDQSAFTQLESAAFGEVQGFKGLFTKGETDKFKVTKTEAETFETELGFRSNTATPAQNSGRTILRDPSGKGDGVPTNTVQPVAVKVETKPVVNLYADVYLGPEMIGKAKIKNLKAEVQKETKKALKKTLPE